MLRFILLLVALLTLLANSSHANTPLPTNRVPSDAKVRFERLARQIHVGMSFNDVFALLPRSERLPGEPYALSVPMSWAGRTVTYQLAPHYTLGVTYGGPDHRVSAPALLQYSPPTKK